MSELKGQALRGEERRKAVIDAAIEVFAERGYRSGALADVGEKIGLSPAGILYHFGSKEALLLAVIAERDRRAGEVLASDPGLQGVASLRSTVRFAEQSERERGLVALHTVLQTESLESGSVTHEYFLERSRFVRLLFADALQQAKALGEIRADVDIEAKATEIAAFLDGAAMVWLLDPAVSLVELYTTYFDDLACALAPAPDAEADA
jgi:AcrR family transcriptional regulator